MPGRNPRAHIWHNGRGSGNPLLGGYNHNEFLIFRIRGVPTPGATALFGLGGLVAIRRRR